MAEGALRFRRDLTASKMEADGVLYVEVSDPRSGSSFRFYDFEYAVALKLDGRPLDQVATDLRESAELELTVEQLSAFADQLSSLGFAEPAPGFFPPLAEDETGEWASPPIRALESPGSAGLFNDEPRSPPPAARSLGEHTFTTYPPEVRPSSWAGDGKSEAGGPPSEADARMDADGDVEDDATDGYKPIEARSELSRTPTPTPTPGPDPAATDLAMPRFGFGGKTPTPTPTPEPTPAPSPFGRAKLPGTPTPEPLGTGATTRPLSPFASPFARDDGASNSEATIADARPPTIEELAPRAESAPQIEDAVRGATEGLGDLSSLLGEPNAEKTPVPGEVAPAPVPVTPPFAPTFASPFAPAPPSVASAPSDRQELPTKRLRAVSDLAAEEPGEILHDPDQSSVPPAPFPGLLPGSLAAMKMPSPGMGAAASPTANLPPAGGSASVRPSEVGRLPSWVAYAALGTLAAVVIAVVAYKYKAVDESPPVAVRTEVPAPSTVYRYWDQTGTVERAEGTAFAFASEGKVAELAATGAQFGGGDVIGLLESGKRFRAELLHNRERLTYYEQRREEMVRDNNRPEIRQSEIKIAEKRRLIDEAQAGLTKHAIVALQSGEVAEAMAKPGDTMKEGQPALRVKGTTYRATFTMSAEDAQKARQLGFCRVEIEGKPIDCSLSAEGGDETRVVIDLPNDAVVAAGKSARLSRDRLEGVFNLPASAVEKVGDSHRLYVVVGGGPGLPTRAEPRVIAVAASTDTHVVVSQGIDVGDRVIVDRPPALKADDRVMISE